MLAHPTQVPCRMLNTDTHAALLARARAAGADFADVYVERWRRRQLRTVNARVAEATSGIQLGAGIRLFFGTDVIYGYTNSLTEEALTELLDSLAGLKKADGGRPDGSGRGGVDLRRETAAAQPHAPRVLFEDHDKPSRLERLRELDAAARSAPASRRGEGRPPEGEQGVWISSSEGLWATDRRVRTRLIASAIASDETGTQTGFSGPGKSMGLELLEHFPPEQIGRRAGEAALHNLRATPTPAGTMPVVMGTGFGGVIFHEALGHLLETTSVARKASALTDMVGEQVARPVVTDVDEGLSAHGWGSSRIDDEGAPTESTVLIRNGILESYMVDRWGALMTGYRATGSGRRQDYTFAPTSRMRNTIVENGDTPTEDLFRGIDLGLYAKGLGGGQVKPGSGEYNFAVTEGFMIRNGEIAEPVRGAMLLGKGPDTIRKIAAVSDDLSNEPGMCGSMSGSLPVEIGQPHLLVSELVVGGEA